MAISFFQKLEKLVEFKLKKEVWSKSDKICRKNFKCKWTRYWLPWAWLLVTGGHVPSSGAPRVVPTSLTILSYWLTKFRRSIQTDGLQDVSECLLRSSSLNKYHVRKLSQNLSYVVRPYLMLGRCMAAWASCTARGVGAGCVLYLMCRGQSDFRWLTAFERSILPWINGMMICVLSQL